MAYITKELYAQKIGEPPEDFDKLNDFTTAFINQETLWGLIGRDLKTFPQVITDTLANCAALQIQFLDMQGGVDSFSDTQMPSMALGKFSYSGGMPNSNQAGQLCSTAKANLVLVNAYLRGLI